MKTITISLERRLITPTTGSACQFQRYLRIRADRAEINANVAMLFANGVCERDLPRDSSMPSDLVMICQWASLFYAIDGFPDDDLLWRIEWLGGVGSNTS